MSYQRTFDHPEPVDVPPCMFLRSKAIYVTGDPDPKDPSELGSTRFHCWCNKTLHVLGPDDGLVDRSECTPNRSCYIERG